MTHSNQEFLRHITPHPDIETRRALVTRIGGGKPNSSQERFVAGLVPRGREPTKVITILRQLANADTPDAVERIKGYMRKNPVTAAYLSGLEADDERLRVHTADTIIDRLDGKATTRVEVQDDNGSTIVSLARAAMNLLGAPVPIETEAIDAEIEEAQPPDQE